jgi:hypothetical protein
MAKQMRICDQDLIINKVVSSIEKIRREAFEKDIKSQPEWEEFNEEILKYQEEYDKIENLKTKLNLLRCDFEQKVKNFNEKQGYKGYREGIQNENYASQRPNIYIGFEGMDYSIRQEITEEVRFAGMSGDFNPKEMVADLVAKFS